MREWYCKVNETPGKQEGGTMNLREQTAKLIWADGTGADHGFELHPKGGTCYKIADQILALLCEEVEKVENPLFSSSHKGAIHNASLGFEQCRQKVLALLRGDNETKEH